MAVYPGLTFKGLTPRAAYRKHCEITRVQSEDEREDCWRRLKDLQTYDLLHIMGYDGESAAKLVQSLVKPQRQRLLVFRQLIRYTAV